MQFQLYLQKKLYGFIFGILTCISFFLIPFSASAQTEWLPPNFTDQLVTNNWNQVVGFTFDANKRMYAWEKAGYVWITDTNGNKLTTPLLDIHHEVGNWVDHGLNGFALDPGFLTNGYYYLFYTVDRHYLLNYGTPAYLPNTNEYNNATIARIVRYQANAATNFTTTIAASRTILIGDTKKNGIMVQHTSHSGGTLLFGKDGSLLISTGDGASFNGVDTGSCLTSYYAQAMADTMMAARENVGSFRSQMLDSYNGKILRIDPATGLGLPTNPFYDPLHPEAIRSKVWCLGLRNPFRITLQPNTGDTDITAGNPGVLMIGDVGWFKYEELNVSKQGGENFGWPIYEGLEYNKDYQPHPIANMDAPNPLYNGTTCTQAYFTFQNLLKQATLATTVNFKNPCDQSQLITSYPSFFHTRPQIEWRHNLFETRTGTFNGNTATTTFIDAPGSPVTGSQFAGNTSLAGTWYTDNRMPPEYQNKYFHLDYGTQWIKRVSFNSNFEATAVDSFCNELPKAVFLTVNPNDGCFNYIGYQNNEIHKICYTAFINNPPTPVIAVNKKYGASPLSVNFNGSASHDVETKVNLMYQWKFGDGAVSGAKIVTHTYNVPSGIPTAYWASLKVTDSLGLSKTDSVLITVNNTPPLVDITSIRDGDYYSVSQQSVVDLIAQVSDAEQANSTLHYAWQVILNHNNHTHPGPLDSDSVTYATIDPEGCNGGFFAYSIVLKVTDPLGLTTTDTVRLYPACSAPVAAIANPDKSICKGKSVQFADASQTVSTWKWTFTGGTPSTSTLKSPLVVYNTPGVYNVKLKVTNPAGVDSIIRTGMITVNGPTAALSSANDSICPNATLAINATPATGVTYKWFKDGIFNGLITGSVYNATAPATYSVTVKDVGNCTHSASKTIGNKGITTTITSDKPSNICYGDSIILSVVNPGNYNYQWQKVTSNIAGATATSYKTKVAAKYRVSTNNNGCVAQSPYIEVFVSPSYTIAANGSLSICTGDSVQIIVNPSKTNYTYQWVRNGNPIGGANILSYYAKTAGSYKVMVTDTSGCSKTSTTFKVIINCKFSDPVKSAWLENMSVQPNPATDMIALSFSLQQSEEIVIKIYDITGREIYFQKNESEAGENQIEINTANLSEGIYCLEVSGSKNRLPAKIKFVKSK
ncbi:MAG: PKD domain-containing protein [Bacteroidia bacterium]